MTVLGRFGVALTSDEILLTASITPSHRSLLASYRMNAHRGADSARHLILRDLRNFLDLGALDRATDLLIVLALFTREEKKCDRRLSFATCRHRDAITLQHWRGGPRRHAIGAAKAPCFKSAETRRFDDPAHRIDGRDEGEFDSPR